MARKTSVPTDPNQSPSTTGDRTPQTKSEAIRWALKELGDSDAPAAAVRDLILKRWPKLKQQVQDPSNWSQIVSLNRKKAAEEFGLRSKSVPDDAPTTSTEFRSLKSLINLCGGDPKRLRGLLEEIEKLGSLARVIHILTEWEELTGTSTQEGV